MNTTAVTGISCTTLLMDYRSRKKVYEARRLRFGGVGGRDVYNITAPFIDGGELVIAGRVESRHTEFSDAVFFTYDGKEWTPKPGSKVYNLQDPFFARIHGEIIFGGTHVFSDGSGRISSWRTDFYRGENINDLTFFAYGPEMMKDIRLVELADGKIGVFTRPLDLENAKAKIGFISITSLRDLSKETIGRAKLFDGLFDPREWGGVNEPTILSNGLIGILGHMAFSDKRHDRHYYSVAFAVDPHTLKTTRPRIIAERDDFLPGPSKKPDIKDCLFSGGIVRNSNGTAYLYAGVGDTQAQCILIKDPFCEMETICGI